VIAGVLAGIWVVARYFAPTPAVFEVRKDLRIPPQEREHKMNMAEFDALTPKPALQEKLASLRPTDFALPELPAIPLDQMLPLDPSSLISDQVSSLVGAAGMGGGGAGAGGLGGTGEGFSFFGIQSDARRVLLLFDVSNTTARKTREAGFPFDRIKEETLKLVDGMGLNSRFAVAMFARNFVFSSDELIAPTAENKEAVTEWVERYFFEPTSTKGPFSSNPPRTVTGSPGFNKLMEAAFAKEPDAIFVISDGGFWEGSSSSPEGQRRIPYRDIERVIQELQKQTSGEVDIHFIGAGMDREDRNFMRRIISRHGGTGRFQEMR